MAVHSVTYFSTQATQQRQQEDQRRLEEARQREFQEGEARQPPRPKSAPLFDRRNGHDVDDGNVNTQRQQQQQQQDQRFATMKRMREERDGADNRLVDLR